MPLPSKVVGAYFQLAGPSGHTLASIHDNFNVVFIAFAKGANTTSGTLHLQPATQGDSSLRADITTLKSRGVKVILSIGGSNDINGTSHGYHLSTSTQISEATTSLSSLISSYGFDGIDIDFEAPYNFTVSAMASVVSSLKASFPSLIVTMAPEFFDANSSTGQYRTLANTLGANLDAIGPQYYNHGVSESQSLTDILSLSRTLRTAYGPERVLIGVMSHDDAHTDTDNTDTNNTTTIVTDRAAWATLVGEAPTMAGMYIWNSYYDHVNATDGADAFATLVGGDILSSSTTPPSPGPGGGGGPLTYPPNAW